MRTLALVDEGISVEGGSVEVMAKPVDFIDLRERAYAVVRGAPSRE